jgi:uncharacterized caspase-like protein
LNRFAFPANDVAELNTLLQTDDFKFDQIITLIDQPKHIIEEKLDIILSKSSFSDFMMIYFSGHGKLNARGDLFLSCRNTKESSLNSTGFKYRHLMEMLEAHSAESVAILLDCCYAGRALSGFRGSVSEHINAQVDSGRGIFILGASGATQTAEEREQDGHGIFTRQIIEGLRTGAADVDGDGQISLNDLAIYVRVEFKRKNVPQLPVVGNYEKSGRLILGSNLRVKHEKTVELIRIKVNNMSSILGRCRV